MATITTTITTTITKTFYQTYWREYELYCMKYHQEKYGHTTWHWMNVPESVLLNSGYIHDFNRLRLKRKEAYERDGVFYNPIQEYGLDGFAEEKCGEDRAIYHGIQAKLWNPKSILTATDLGTFFAAMLGRLRMKSSDSKGYLYHTCRLQVDVRDDILNTRGIIQQELLPFDESHLKSITTLLARSLDRAQSSRESSVPSSSELLPSISESAYTLRGYQEEAITMLGMGWTGVGLLNLPCGTGKTVIFSNHLREKKYKNVIIVSPLRVHAEQTLKRVKAFLPEYDQLLLDSDGSTDIDDLNNMLEKRSVISTTFKSFVQVIRQLFMESTESDGDDENEVDEEVDESDEEVDDAYSESSSKESVYEPLIDLSDTLVIVDEAHNVASMSDEKQEMIKIIQSFPKALLVTATPPSSMEEMIGCTTIYQYPFRRAIEEGHICDYQVYLPMIMTDEASGESSVYIEKPIELSDLNGDMVQKSLYLLSGMLQTGSKRCIAYMSQKKECDLFVKVLTETNQKYHYLDLTVNLITNLVSGSKRKKILEDFQKDDGRGEIKILCSIRILDEGIDLPACDSVFIGNVTESSNEIKMVQRICRANRLVESRPYKVARCFLWADDHRKIVGSLSLLKENDIEFHKKIKVINGDYEKSGDTEMIDLVGKHNATLKEFIKVKCMSYEEIRKMKFTWMTTFMDKYKRDPSTRSKDSYEKSLGIFWNGQKKKIKSVTDALYQEYAVHPLAKASIDKTIEGRKKESNTPSDIIAFMDKYKRDPSNGSKDQYEKSLGRFWNNQKAKIKSDTDALYKEYAVHSLTKASIDKTLERRQKESHTSSDIITFMDKYKRDPSTISKDTYEKGLGQFWSQQKKNIKSVEDLLYQEYAVHPLTKASIDKTLEGRKKETFTHTKNDVIAFMDKYKRDPSTHSKDLYEKSLGIFWIGQKGKIKSVEDFLYQEYAVNSLTKASIDKTLEGRKKESFSHTPTDIITFMDKYNRDPSHGSKDAYEKSLGRFWSQQKCKIKSVKDTLYQVYAGHLLAKASIDKTIESRQKESHTSSDIITFMDKYNRDPSHGSKDAYEKNLAIFWSRQKGKIKSVKDTLYQVYAGHLVAKASIDNTLMKRSKKA